jgi:hypothetical protein
MAAMHTYPIINVSETFIRQAIYDSLPETVRATLSFDDFRQHLQPEDYRYFASVLSDLVNDYLNEHELFGEFVAQAVDDLVAKRDNLSKLYLSRDILYRESEKRDPDRD